MRLDPEEQVPSALEGGFLSFLHSIGLVKQVMEPYFAQFGISGPQWAIMRVLHRAEEKGEPGLRLKDAGERLLVQPPSVTGLVDRLERQGLLKRGDSKGDLRVRRVSLTPEGRKLVERILVGHPKQIQLLFAGFEARELGKFLELLKSWEGHLEKLAGKGGT